MKKISLSLIAKEARVSKSVVSAVLSKQENKKIFVSDKTKEKILNIAQQYNYILPKSGKELVSGRSDTIGIMFHMFTPFFGEVLTEIQKKAFKKNLDISIYFTSHRADLEEQFLEQSRDGRVDGLIILGWVNKESPERYKKYFEYPYNIKILNYGAVFVEGLPTISFDEKQAGILAYQHLKEIGCKTFAGFGGSQENSRIDSFCKEAEKDGAKVKNFFQSQFIGNWEEEGKLASKFFETTKNIPEGIFCYNDLYALGLISEAQKRGIKIPRDIAIIGCDNTQICLYLNPSITSIDTNKAESAKKMIEIITNLINGTEPNPINTIIPVSLVERESTKRR
ncbi:MAG: LacI family transcriptional regulator [Candidatus Omnitrophica bacterium]|jgi:DNA-binding LacI/PurR family transcriptional regulator|nr:LacI family transcriptional regulator [Candidatus Omnitrophota bacterium]